MLFHLHLFFDFLCILDSFLSFLQSDILLWFFMFYFIKHCLLIFNYFFIISMCYLCFDNFLLPLKVFYLSLFEDFSTSLVFCDQFTLLLINFNFDMVILYPVASPLLFLICFLQLNQLIVHIFRERLNRFPLWIGRIKMVVYGALLHGFPGLWIRHFFLWVINLSLIQNPWLLVQHIVGFGIIPNVFQILNV